jgi:hypothetical protein
MPGQKWTTPTWILLTDGSGHKDGYGGYASLALEHATGRMLECAGALKGTSTEAAEFLALLNGLGSIVEATGNTRKLEAQQPVVHWMTDRESLALAVWRENGQPVYKRKSTPELWAMFAYYEPLFTIVPLFTPRATLPLHDRVDKVASECRIIIKDYYEILNS